MALIPIRQQHLPLGEATNRPGTFFIPRGLAVHATANPGVGDEEHAEYFAGGYRGASAHVFVDWDSATELIPWQPGVAEHGWHAGRVANRLFISLEICEHTDPKKALASYRNGVDVAAQMLAAYGWGVEQMIAHDEITEWFGGTDHTDPHGYFASIDKSWGDFVSDVHRTLRGDAPEAEELHEVKVLDASGNVLCFGELRGDTTWVPLRALVDALTPRLYGWDANTLSVKVGFRGQKE